MTILFLARRFYPNMGGVETHVLEVGKRLVKSGHSVIVVTEILSEKKLKKNYLKKQDIVNGIEIIRINVGSNDRFKKFRIWREFWKIRSTVNKADIIHCHDVFFWYLPFRFLYPGKRVFTTFHGYETNFPPSKKAVIIRKLSELLSNGNICIGEYIKKWYGTKPNYVIYGGVEKLKDFSLKENRHPIYKPKIVLIGRLEADIGVKIYLKSLEFLKRRNSKFYFQALGDGSLKKEIKKYGKVLGFIENIGIVIKTSDIVFASSYLLMLEALVLRKKIIAVFDNPLKEDYLKMSPFANFIYICKNAKEVVQVIESEQKSPWKNKSMIDNGYKWAKAQTWDEVVSIYLKLWRL